MLRLFSVRKLFLWMSFFVLLTEGALGQVWVKVAEPQSVQWKSLIPEGEIVFSDTIALFHWRDSLLNGFLQRGYFDAKGVFERKDSNHFILNTYPGPLYKWKLDSSASVPKAIATGNAFDWLKYKEISIGKLEELVDNGYPFAQIYLSDVRLGDNAIGGKWKVDSGRLFYIRGIQVNGTARLSKYYLMHYLGLHRDKPYSQKMIRRLSGRLNELPFVQQQGVPVIRFYKEYAEIVVHLDPKPSNTFDVLLGVAQDNTGGARSYALTGYARLAFSNLFGQAERMALDYQGLKQTQSLAISTDLPYVLQTSIGAGGAFKLYNKTGDFTETDGQLYMTVDLSVDNKLQIVGRQKTARVAKLDTQYVLVNNQLPERLDYNQSSFGLKWRYEHFDYAPNPLSGWKIKLSGAIGKNSTVPNPALQSIREINIDSLYEARNAYGLRWEGGLQLLHYQKIFKRSTLVSSIQGKGIFSFLPLSESELYRIGGGRSIRGFGEEQFRASKYFFSTLEYRFHTSKNGFLAVFSDYGYLERTLSGRRIYLHPLGVGLGFVFETKGGIFQLQYAVGKTENTVFDFTNGQVHLGYLSVF